MTSIIVWAQHLSFAAVVALSDVVVVVVVVVVEGGSGGSIIEVMVEWPWEWVDK
jgi:hypothetical protein